MKKTGFFKKLVISMMAVAMVATSLPATAINVEAASATAVKKVVVKQGSKNVTKKTITLKAGKSATLKVTVTPSKAKKSVAFKSSKTSVATVSKKGKVTAKKAGNAKITVTVTGKNKKKKSTYVKVKVEKATPAPAPSTAPSVAPSTTPGVQPQTATMKDGVVILNIKNATSSNPAIATVDATGKVVAGTQAGTVTITGKDADGKDVAYTITVSAADVAAVTQVTAVAFDKAEYVVEKGTSTPAVITVTPDNATDKSVKYASADEKIATVTDAGVIFGFAAGSTTITATSANGKTATAKVTVKEPVVINLNKTTADLGLNQTIQLQADVADVTWKSDNTEVASVTADGLVKGLKAGKATIIATSGTASASCVVNVSKYDPANDGVTLSVFNPIKNNSVDGTTPGEVIEKTVLINQDMIIQAYVQADGAPKKGARVTLKLEEIDSHIVSLGDFVITVGGFATNEAETNADGYAEFKVKYNGTIPSTYDKISDCPYISLKAKTTVDNTTNVAPITVKFASVLRSGILVDNDHDCHGEIPDPINPFVGHATGDDGVAQSWNTNDYYPVEYVTSHQVGSDVYLSATPYFILPPEKKNTDDKFVVTFPDKTVVTGQKDVEIIGTGYVDEYTIYNSGMDESTTTQVINIPEGLVSMSVLFNKISISKYSELYVTLYNATGGRVDGTTYTEYEFEKLKAEGAQFSFAPFSGTGHLVVSIKSPGQVDLGTTGYHLASVTGEFTKQKVDLPEMIEVDNSVIWSDVTASARYSTPEKLEFNDVAGPNGLLKEYAAGSQENTLIVNNSNYTFSYRVPLFNSDSSKDVNAVIGNALITATYKDEAGKVKTATYAYPCVRDTAWGESLNKNVMVPKASDVKAIFLGNDVIDSEGNIQQKTGGFTQIGNIADVKPATSNVSGAIFMSAKLKIDALQYEVNDYNSDSDFDKSPLRGADSKYPLFSYVQFVAKPEAGEVYGTQPVFHALENQYIVITGEVIAENTENQTSQNVDFYWGSTKIEKDTVLPNDVKVMNVDKTTNAEGKAYLILYGVEGSHVEDISAKYEGTFKTFNVYVGDEKLAKTKLAADDEKFICDLCWIDLGIAYQKDATVPGTWIYNYKDLAEKTASDSVVNKRWLVGYLPIAKCHDGAFEADYDALNAFKRDVDPLKVAPANTLVSISDVDVTYSVEHSNTAGKTEERADGRVISTSKTGETTVFGGINLKKDSVVIEYYNNDIVPELVTMKTVGYTSPEYNSKKYDDKLKLQESIEYTMTWTPGNWAYDFIYPYSKTVAEGQSSEVYFRLHDADNNAIVNQDVVVTALYNGTEYANGTIFTAPAKTDAKGLVKIEVDPLTQGEIVFTMKLTESLSYTSATIGIEKVAVGTQALKLASAPEIYAATPNKVVLKFNNVINKDVLPADADQRLTVLKKLFRVTDYNYDPVEVTDVVIGERQIELTLATNFKSGEYYEIEISTSSAELNGITYVLTDKFGQAIKYPNSDINFAVDYITD